MEVNEDKNEDKLEKPVFRLEINDTKAGMDNLDKEKINSIILKHSQNSRFYRKQKLKDEELKTKAQQKLKIFNSFSRTEIDAAQYAADIFIKQSEESQDLSRILVHIDMDAFYANVEIRDNPSLADKPMAVGSDSMLSTSNYIARRYGVRAAMPGFIAKELCPELIIVPCNFKKYRADSAKIMKIISEYDPNYSAMSLDEAYLDLTDYLKTRSELKEAQRTFPKFYFEANNENLENSSETVTFDVDAEECVKEIRHRIYLSTRLTASAGIGCNLRLAKLCSDINKPNGQFRLDNDQNTVIQFIDSLPIRKINGIGPSTALILECYDIKVCKDLYKKRAMIYLLETQNTFEFLMRACRGLGSTKIEHDYEKKSLGHETTFPYKISNNHDEFLKICQTLSEEVSEELTGFNLEALKVNLKLKTINFEVYSRTKTLNHYTNNAERIYEAAKHLLDSEWKLSKGKLKLRLLGVRVHELRELGAEATSTTKSLTIENFFKKEKKATFVTQSPQNRQQISDSESGEDFYTFCPHCDNFIEGNQEFIKDHADSCFKLNSIKTSKHHHHSHSYDKKPAKKSKKN